MWASGAEGCPEAREAGCPEAWKARAEREAAAAAAAAEGGL